MQLSFCIKYRKTLFGKEERQKLNLALFTATIKKGIKNVDLRNRITSMHCSSVKGLFEDDFHDWKVIFKFHNNIDTSDDIC